MFEPLGRICLKRTFLCLFLITALLLLAACIAPGASAAASDRSWTAAEVEYNIANPNIATDLDGNAHISYVKDSKLYTATFDGSSWTHQLIDGASICGYNTDIAIDSQGNTHLMYLDTTLGYAWNLMYANNIGGSYMIYDLGQSVSYGFDMTLDSEDHVHVAYHLRSNSAVSYGTNAGGSWTFGEVLGGSLLVYTGTEFSLSLDSQDRPHIAAATFNSANSKDNIMYVRYDGSTWSSQLLDTATNVLHYVKLSVDNSDKVHLSYVESTNRDIRYTTNAGGSWSSTTLTTAYDVQGTSFAMVTDSLNKVHITFVDVWPKDIHYYTNDDGSWSSADLTSSPRYNDLMKMAIGPEDDLHVLGIDTSFYARYLYGEGPVTWAPAFENAPADGRETQAYSFIPDLNETDAVITAHSTNAPFLSWTGTGYSGTPSTSQSGTYWISVSAQSVPGTLTATLNETIVIADTWGPQFLNAPSDGQETVPYTYEPELNDSCTITAHSTNAPFLSWDGSRYAGTPDSAASGTYWISITAQSTPGLLSATLNETLIINDTWAPVPTAFPLDGQETASYEFHPAFNDTSAAVVYMDTNASFLELIDEDVKFTFEDKYFAGTPGQDDAGVYWINVTAVSGDGLLLCYLNETFVIADSYQNHITNSPGDGREAVYYQYSPTFDGAMTLIDWHSDADWMLLYGPLEKGPGFPNYWYGTPEVGDAGTYYLNITLQSIGGLLYTTHNFTFEVNISWSPTFENAPDQGRVNVPYGYEPSFNESDATVMSYSTNAHFLTWNGSAYVGTPGLDDAGTYWINISAYSPSGLLETYANESFEILPMPRSLRINSDADMLAAVNEFKWTGDGSADDPFIVTGLVIDSLGIHENSLFIGNVTYHFVVTENSLGNHIPEKVLNYWSDTIGAALYIYNCQYAAVVDNYLWGGNLGYMDTGMVLFHSDGVVVSENLLEDFAGSGIRVLDDCYGTRIENNTLSGPYDTGTGIMIIGAYGTMIRNNSVNAFYCGIGVNHEGFIPVGGETIIMDNQVNDFDVGISLDKTENISIINNTLTNGDGFDFQMGMSLWYVGNVTINHNSVLNCLVGIQVETGANIWMEGNSLSGTYGVALIYVDRATILNGTISSEVSDFGSGGVVVVESSEINIGGLNITGGEIGMHIAASSLIGVIGCSFSGIQNIGVQLNSGTQDTMISECDFRDFVPGFSPIGVHLNEAYDCAVLNCTFDGLSTGILSDGLNNRNSVIGNQLMNGSIGIMFEQAEGGLVQNNTLLGMANNDIIMNECNYTVLDGNDIHGERTHGSGISLSLCIAITLRNNSIEDGAILFDIDAGSESVSGHDIDTSNTVGGKPVYYYDYGDYMWSSVPDDGGQIIIVSATNLIVSGLQTTSCTAPIYIICSVGIRIYGLDLYGSGVGVTMLDSGDIWIVDGSIENMSIGILGLYVEHLLISGMSMTDNYDAIYVATSEFGPASHIDVEVCLIEGSRNFGINFDGVESGSISSSVIANSVSYGLMITNSQNIMVVENLFYRNNGAGEGYSVPTQVYADSDTNYFDNNGRGNFWSEQLGPDADMDGVVDDFTYPIDGDLATDNYPLAFVFITEPVTEGRYGIAYEYLPGTDQPALFRLNTNSSFLLIDPMSGRISGTPNACGSFYLHIGATLMGYLDIWQNYTLVVNDTWAPDISGTPGTGKETVEYVYQPSVNESDAIVAADTDADFLIWNGTAFVGTPGLNDAGIYWINITATSVPGLLTSWYNSTFVVEDTWASQFTNTTLDGQETVYFRYRPSFNETVDLMSAYTNAPFLDWNGKMNFFPGWYYEGTPGQDDAGEYWINITVRSADGLLVSWQNSTFVIGDSWAPSFDNFPKDGQETVDYAYGPKFNESATITGFATNAPFLSWNGSAYVGTPTLNDAGEYWINITVRSADGLLESWQNSTFVIGDSWAPSFDNVPQDGQETLEYEYGPLFNETVMITGHLTNAPFLSWNGSAFVGTPTLNDAGEYWINVTALSVLGLLESWQNSTFVIGDSWAPEIVSNPVELGRETLDYVYAPQANETVTWGMNTNAPFLDWNGSAVIGIPNVTSSGTYYVNLTAVSTDGLLASWQNYTLTVNDTWTTGMTNGPLGGQETVSYVFAPQFNETVTNVIAVTNAPFLSWNGTAFVGTPTVADAGEYWVDVTVTSVPGLLDASWNLTFAIGEAWAPVFLSEPQTSGWASLAYVYQLEANESVVFSMSTDADFLSLANGTISGTMEAGTYYVNVTATSVDGLLSSWQNYTLAVGTDDAAPNMEMVSPANGARLNATSVVIEFNVTDEGSGVAGIWIKVDGGNWTAVSGTNATIMLSGGEHNITVRSVDAVGNEAEEGVIVFIDLIAPTISSAVPQGDDVSLDAPIVITFSEAMDAGSVVVTVNGQPAIITWNGSVATIAGDWEYDTEYIVAVSGQDLAGNSMDAMSFSFVTEQQLVVVSGTLLDDEGNPVANASISMNGVVVAVTGADGSYSFQLVPGEYLVAISAEGYEDQAMPLTIDAESVSLDVEMHGIHEASDGSLWWLALVMIAIILGLLYMIRRQF